MALLNEKKRYIKFIEWQLNRDFNFTRIIWRNKIYESIFFHLKPHIFHDKHYATTFYDLTSRQRSHAKPSYNLLLEFVNPYVFIITYKIPKISYFSHVKSYFENIRKDLKQNDLTFIIVIMEMKKGIKILLGKYWTKTWALWLNSRKM